MTKPLPFLILVLVSVLSLHAQKPPKGLEVKYDKFQDETLVITDYLYTGSRDQTVWFEYTFRGQTLKADAGEFVMVVADKCGSRYCFYDFDAEIVFLIDGERLKKSNPDHQLASDIILFDLTRSELAKIANAKTVEFQVGRREGAIRSEDLSILKSLLTFTSLKK